MKPFNDNYEQRLQMIEVVEKEYSASGDLSIIWYKTNAPDRLDYQLRRNPQRLDLDYLVDEFQNYYVRAINIGDEKRRQWVWVELRPITPSVRSILFTAHMRRGRDHFNEPLPPVLEKLILDSMTSGYSAKGAYQAWLWAKELNEGNDPTGAEVVRVIAEERKEKEFGKRLIQQADDALRQLQQSELMTF